jgi:hypothetical protein
MLGHELAIKEGETAVLQTGHNPGHRHFRCICGTRKHAFPEKSLAHCQSVKAADQPPVAPAFHTMRQTRAVEIEKGVFDFAVDPCFLSIIDTFGA